MAAIAERSLQVAKVRGASDAEAEVSAAVGQSVTVRQGEVETVEYNRDKGLGITVYFGNRRGNASTSDLSDEAVVRTVEAACAIARYTAAETSTSEALAPFCFAISIDRRATCSIASRARGSAAEGIGWSGIFLVSG